MEDAKKPGSEPCCTVKVVCGSGDDSCCPEATGERVIVIKAEEIKGKTIKVVCCPEEKMD